MTYPSPDDFRTLLSSRPLRDLAVEHVLSGEPFAFRNDAAALNQLTGHLAEQLGVDNSSIRVVGSGRIGFSLNPANFPKAFSRTSDIDVVVVDNALFDRVWLERQTCGTLHRTGAEGPFSGGRNMKYWRFSSRIWRSALSDLVTLEGGVNRS